MSLGGDEQQRMEAAKHYVARGIKHANTRDFPEAIVCFREAAKCNVNLPEPYVRLAFALNANGQTEQAIAVLHETLEVHPDWADLHYTLGRVLEDKGDFTGAVAAYERAIELKPRNIDAFLGMVCSRKINASDRKLIEYMELLQADSMMPPEFAIKLHEALGKAYDDLGESELAIGHVDQAKAISKALRGVYSHPINLKYYEQSLEHASRTYTREFFQAHKGFAFDTDLPVFVVGMHRSGSTLLEHMLCTHPKIGAISESKFWYDHAPEIEALVNGPSPDAQKAKQIARRYCATLKAAAPTSLRVIDKMNFNYMYLGFLHTLFPNARIIDCRRHPVDNCLSIYLTPYRWVERTAQNRETIFALYRNYQKFMDHWKSVLPSDSFLEVEYEELVRDRAAVLKNAVAFCGLEWDDACLHHEDNKRIVQTPSRWQVRQPIYTTSITKWKRYAPWLGVFRELLTPEEKAELGD